MLYARTPPLGKETCVIGIAPQFFVHFIVQGFVDAVFYLLELRDLAATLRLSAGSHYRRARCLGNSSFGNPCCRSGFFEGQNGMVSAFLK
jgi:hypothetical protein